MTSLLPPRPRVPAPTPPRFPTAQRLSLPNGVEVALYHLPDQQLASIICHLGVPADREPAGKDGLLAVAGACLSPSGRNPSGRQVCEHMAGLGMSWNTEITHTGPRIQIQVPLTHLDDALWLLAEQIIEPSLEPGELEAERAILLAALAAAEANPAHYATRLLPGALFHPCCRASRPLEGSRSSLQQITTHDLTEIHAALATHEIQLTIAGDLRGIDVAAVLTAAFGDKPSHVKAHAQLPSRRADPPLISIERPGASQTHLLLGAVIPGLADPAWPALSLIADILGRPTTGRLNQMLRERDRFTYGLRVRLHSQPGTGFLRISGDVRSDATSTALRRIWELLRVLGEQGLSDREINQAQFRALGMAALRYETAHDIAKQAADVMAEHLPLALITQHLDALTALSPEQVNDVLTQALNPHRFAAILIGDSRDLPTHTSFHDLSAPPPATNARHRSTAPLADPA